MQPLLSTVVLESFSGAHPQSENTCILVWMYTSFLSPALFEDICVFVLQFPGICARLPNLYSMYRKQKATIVCSPAFTQSVPVSCHLHFIMQHSKPCFPFQYKNVWLAYWWMYNHPSSARSWKQQSPRSPFPNNKYKSEYSCSMARKISCALGFMEEAESDNMCKPKS